MIILDDGTTRCQGAMALLGGSTMPFIFLFIFQSEQPVGHQLRNSLSLIHKHFAKLSFLHSSHCCHGIPDAWMSWRRKAKGRGHWVMCSRGWQNLKEEKDCVLVLVLVVEKSSWRQTGAQAVRGGTYVPHSPLADLSPRKGPDCPMTFL